MIDFLKSKLKGKRVLLLGFGREGQSSYRLLRSVLPDLYLGVADKNPEINTHELLNDFDKTR